MKVTLLYGTWDSDYGYETLGVFKNFSELLKELEKREYKVISYNDQIQWGRSGLTSNMTLDTAIEYRCTYRESQFTVRFFALDVTI